MKETFVTPRISIERLDNLASHFGDQTRLKATLTRAKDVIEKIRCRNERANAPEWGLAFTVNTPSIQVQRPAHGYSEEQLAAMKGAPLFF